MSTIEDMLRRFRGEQKPASPDAELQQVLQQYPRLAGQPWQVGYGHTATPGQQLEFYHPDEERNPKRGSPYIEIYNRGLQGNALKTAIFGDMLHHAPTFIPEFSNQRQQFQCSFTPEQADFNRRKYRELQNSGREARPFDQWMDKSGLDAYIRGYLAPDAADEWRKAGVYTPEQIKILEGMKRSLGAQQ